MRIGRKLAAVGLTVGGMMLLGLGPVYGDVVGTEGPTESGIVEDTANATSATADAVETDAAVSLSPLGRVATSVQESVSALVGVLDFPGDPEPPSGCELAPEAPGCDDGDEGGEGGDEGDEGEGGGDPLDPCLVTPDAPGCEDDGDEGDGGDDPLNPCELAPEAPGCEDGGDDDGDGDDSDDGGTTPDPGDVLCTVDPDACDETGDPGNDNPGNGGNSGNGGNGGNGGNSGNGNGGVEAGQGSNGGGAQAEGTVPGNGSSVPSTAVVGCTDPGLCSATVLGDEASTYPAADSAVRNRALPETGSSSTNLPLTVGGGAMLVGGALLMGRRARTGV
jgi:LPXTG-motif cell wall-anchored protein